MAESAEHRFLSEAVVSYLEQAASTRLYTFLENDRKRFDFGCKLERDWTRPIVGQTLWKHVEGVDKDLRTLLSDPDAEVCLYVARDTVKARNIWSEAVSDYRRGIVGLPLHKLRTIWIPSDFDLDSESHRTLVARLIENRLARDVLLNVVLGNINGESMRLFISSTGRVGLDLAILREIATHGFFNLRSLAKSVETSPRSLPERLVRLVGCGFLAQPDTGASFYHVSLRGRVFLELCREVEAGHTSDPELWRVVELLALDTPSNGITRGTRLNELEIRIAAAVADFGVDLEDLAYFRYWESEAWPPTSPRPTGMHVEDLDNA